MSPSHPKHGLLALAPTAARGDITGALIGKVVAFECGEVRVTYPGHGSRSLVARTLTVFDDAQLAEAAREGAEAVLLFEGGDPTRPLLVGLLRSQTRLVDALLSGPLPVAEKIMRVDGKRVFIEGHDEVVLQCGKAALTLRRDGKVVLRGVNLVSQAERVHKIRGGKVQVN
jgi:hypothetical protein